MYRVYKNYPIEEQLNESIEFIGRQTGREHHGSWIKVLHFLDRNTRRRNRELNYATRCEMEDLRV